jgi:hypothetical protein
MTKKTTTKAAKIRDYVTKHPNATGVEVMKATGARSPQVYAIMAKMRNEASGELPAKVAKAAPAVVPVKQSTDIGSMLKERGTRYGKFAGHARVSQLLKQSIFGNMSDDKYSQMDYDQIEALEMIAHKIARIVNGDHNYYDNWKDIAGYAKLVSDRLETGASV